MINIETERATAGEAAQVSAMDREPEPQPEAEQPAVPPPVPVPVPVTGDDTEWDAVPTEFCLKHSYTVDPAALLEGKWSISAELL